MLPLRTRSSGAGAVERLDVVLVRRSEFASRRALSNVERGSCEAQKSLETDILRGERVLEGREPARAMSSSNA